MTRFFTFERGGFWYVHVWEWRENHGPFASRGEAYRYASTMTLAGAQP